MYQHIFEIKRNYEVKDLGQLFYTFTNIMGCAADWTELELDAIVPIARKYVCFLAKFDFIAVDPIELIPDTLWGRVPHTLPMMLYRVHSFLSFFNEHLEGSIVISDDFSGFEYRVDVSVGTRYIDMVKMAESILIAKGESER